MHTHVLRRIASIALISWLSLPALVHAHDPMYPKIDVHLRLGLFGDMASSSQRAAMEPSFGGGVEFEGPITNYFSLGGAFEAYAWTVAPVGGTYNASLDFLFTPRFRIPFGDHPWHAEVYFGLLIGPTISLPSDRFAAVVTGTPRDIGIGVTGGGRVGFRWNANDLFGLYVDVGPMMQFATLPASNGGPAFDLWQYQFVMRFGGTFGFAG
jgi:hypothetical protein